MFVVISWQFSFVAPWGELVLLVSMGWSSPNLDVHMPFTSHGLVIRGKQQKESQEDGACCEDGLRID